MVPRSTPMSRSTIRSPTSAACLTEAHEYEVGHLTGAEEAPGSSGMAKGWAHYSYVTLKPCEPIGPSPSVTGG